VARGTPRSTGQRRPRSRGRKISWKPKGKSASITRAAEAEEVVVRGRRVRSRPAVRTEVEAGATEVIEAEAEEVRMLGAKKSLRTRTPISTSSTSLSSASSSTSSPSRSPKIWKSKIESPKKTCWLNPTRKQCSKTLKHSTRKS